MRYRGERDAEPRLLGRIPILGNIPNRGACRLATSTSRFGERHGINWLMYNPLQILAYHRMAVVDAPAVIDVLTEFLPAAHRYLDVGAGSGAYAAEVARRGRAVTACEHARSGRILARLQGVRCRSLDFRQRPSVDLEGSYDVAYCFEVAEHIDPDCGDALVELLVGRAPISVFTAAPPGAGGVGHINERWPAYWIALFEKHGASHDAAKGSQLRRAFAQRGVQAEWFLERPMVFVR